MDGDPDLTETIMDYQRREFVLLSKMAQREREMRKLRQQANEAVNSFEDTKKDSLRGAFVDPVVNSELIMLRQLLRDKDKEMEKLREENHNAPFHPNSIQGQKLLQKCAYLVEENAELGRQLGEEWLQTLRIQIAAERQQRAQLKRRITEFEQHGEQIDAENERMQKRIAGLGQDLKDARAEIDRMRKEIEDCSKEKTADEAAVFEEANKAAPLVDLTEPSMPAPPPPAMSAASASPLQMEGAAAALLTAAAAGEPPHKKRKKKDKEKAGKEKEKSKKDKKQAS